MWGRQSREEEWTKQFARQAQLQNRLMGMLNEVSRLYYRFIARITEIAVEDDNPLIHPEALAMREQIDELLTDVQRRKLEGL